VQSTRRDGAGQADPAVICAVEELMANAGMCPPRWPKQHSFDGGLRFLAPGHDTDIPVKVGDDGGARA